MATGENGHLTHNALRVVVEVCVEDLVAVTTRSPNMADLIVCFQMEVEVEGRLKVWRRPATLNLAQVGNNFGY